MKKFTKFVLGLSSSPVTMHEARSLESIQTYGNGTEGVFRSYYFTKGLVSFSTTNNDIKNF